MQRERKKIGVQVRGEMKIYNCPIMKRHRHGEKEKEICESGSRVESGRIEKVT